MKFSSKAKNSGQSPMRKFHPYAVAAQAARAEHTSPAQMAGTRACRST